MFKFAVKLALLSLMCFETARAMQTERFEFEVDGKTLSGLISLPDENVPIRSLMVYVHGYGKTDVVKGNWYFDFREHFSSWGVGVVIWDKPGCGASEGEFDINQSVQSSAIELIAAVNTLREHKIPGYESIGFWSISRGGWIAPLAIQQDQSIEYWISVSGPSAEENFKYLLEKNFAIEGRSQTQVNLLVDEWQTAFDILSSGGKYEDYLKSTDNLSQDEFYIELTGGGRYSREGFLQEQSRYLSGEFIVSPVSGLQIYVKDFAQSLSAISSDTLAIFGALDTNIDWRKTKALYEKTIGNNSSSSLEIRVFPNADHTIRSSNTGGIREAKANNYSAPHPDNYYDTMRNWLSRHEYANPITQNPQPKNHEAFDR
jgi:hypothetical protein